MFSKQYLDKYSENFPRSPGIGEESLLVSSFKHGNKSEQIEAIFCRWQCLQGPVAPLSSSLGLLLASVR